MILKLHEALSFYWPMGYLDTDDGRLTPWPAFLEVLDFEHVEPVHHHHCFDEIPFEIDVSLKTELAII